MGLEKLGATTGYQAQAAVQSTQVNKASTQTSSDATTSQDAASSTMTHTAAVMQISDTQKGGNLDNNNEQSAKQQNGNNEASIKKLKDIQKVINNNTVAEFGYNEPTNRITIKIKDKDTDEVIKEIPSEKALEMLAKAWELAGIMVDEKR